MTLKAKPGFSHPEWKHFACHLVAYLPSRISSSTFHDPTIAATGWHFSFAAHYLAGLWFGTQARLKPLFLVSGTAIWWWDDWILGDCRNFFQIVDEPSDWSGPWSVILDHISIIWASSNLAPPASCAHQEGRTSLTSSNGKAAESLWVLVHCFRSAILQLSRVWLGFIHRQGFCSGLAAATSCTTQPAPCMANVFTVLFTISIRIQ